MAVVVPFLIQAAVGVAISMLFPGSLPDGPKLSDLKVMSSAYGNMVPVVIGRARISGNVIWSTDKIPHNQHHGKGGGPSYNTTSYTQSFAIALCEGVVVDIPKIYANYKCIYNTSDSATSSTLIASKGMAANIRAYKGTDDQLPDPLIQSLVGAENTSAYRGTCYIVFEDFDLTPYGNQLPNLEFEVAVSATSSAVNAEITTFTEDVTVVTLDSNYQCGWIHDSVNKKFRFVRILLNGMVSELSSFDYASDMYINDIYINFAGSIQKSDDNSLFIYDYNTSTSTFKYWILSSSGVYTLLNIESSIGNYYGNINKYKSIIALTNSSSTSIVKLQIENTNNFLFLNLNGNSSYIDHVFNFPCSRVEMSDNYIYVMEIGWVSETVTVKKYDLNYNYINTFFTKTNVNIDNMYYMLVHSDNAIYITYNIPYSRFYTTEISSGTEIVYHYSEHLAPNISGTIMKYDGANMSYYKKLEKTISSFLTVTSIVPSSLTTAVSRLCSFVKLDSTKINITSLAGINIHGYVIAKLGNLRSALEPLQHAYFFDCVDSDDKLKFVKRGSSVAVEIPSTDIGVHAYGGDSEDNLNTERKQDYDLPKDINLSYFDLNGSYQINTQYARRQNTEAVNVISVELPLVATSDEVLVIAKILLDEAWQSRNTIKFSVSSKYSYLEPSDILILNKANDKFIVKITEIERQNGILTITATTEDVSKYQQEAVGATLIVRSEEVVSIQPTNLQILDIPLLRDQDDGAGAYLAASGYSSNWVGAALTRSDDNGITYNSVKTITRSSVIGTCKTILGNFLSGNIFDELNSLTVTSNKQLYSYDDLSIYNGANCAVIGNETIQFKNATLTAPNTYILSGLLRGKYGTEWRMSTHTANERFILLDFSTIDLLTLSSSDFDLSRIYKAVSNNDYLDNSIAYKFTYSGMSKECYSPVQLGGGRDSAGNITLNWIRRGRLSNGWNNKVDIPLGEATEAYEVDIMNGSTVVRTLISSTNTVNYLSANQVTDFGSNQSNITFTVYQMSTLRGRGVPATSQV